MNGESRHLRASSGTTATAPDELHRVASLPATTDPSDDGDDRLAQMKRRRLAALRLPPLPSGKRDPQFDLLEGERP